MRNPNVAQAGSSSQDMFSSQPSRSQHSQSQQQFLKPQPQPSQNKENNINMDELSNDLMLFFLNYQRSLKPVKKSVITKYFKNLGSAKIFNNVLERVREKLSETMGLDIIEREDGKTTEYYLVNLLIGEVDLTVEQKHVFDDHKLVVLFLVLIAINKSGGKLKEESILQFLKDANIIKDDKRPFAKGYFEGLDIEKFLRQEMTSTSYLAINEIELDDDEKIIEYSWGVRAEAELSIEKLEEFFDQVDEIDDGTKGINNSDEFESDGEVTFME